MFFGKAVVIPLGMEFLPSFLPPVYSLRSFAFAFLCVVTSPPPPPSLYIIHTVLEGSPRPQLLHLISPHCIILQNAQTPHTEGGSNKFQMKSLLPTPASGQQQEAPSEGTSGCSDTSPLNRAVRNLIGAATPRSGNDGGVVSSSTSYSSSHREKASLTQSDLVTILDGVERAVGIARSRKWLQEFLESRAISSPNNISASSNHHRQDDHISDNNWTPPAPMRTVDAAPAPTPVSSKRPRLTPSALAERGTSANVSTSSPRAVSAAPRTSALRGALSSASARPSSAMRNDTSSANNGGGSSSRPTNRAPSISAKTPSRVQSPSARVAATPSSSLAAVSSATTPLQQQRQQRPASPSMAGAPVMGATPTAPVASAMRNGRFAVGEGVYTKTPKRTSSAPRANSATRREVASNPSSPNASISHHQHRHVAPESKPAAPIETWMSLTKAGSASRQLGQLSIHNAVRIAFLRELEDVLVSGGEDLVKYALNINDAFSAGAVTLMPLLTFQLQSLDPEIILLISRVVGQIATVLGRLLGSCVDAYIARILWVRDAPDLVSIYEPLGGHIEDIVERVKSPRLLVHLVEHLRWLEGANASPAGVPALVACCRALRDLSGRCGRDAAPATYESSKSLCTTLALKLLDVMVKENCIKVRYVTDDIIHPLEYTLPYLDDSMCSDDDCRRGLPLSYLEGLARKGQQPHACPVALLRFAAFRKAPLGSDLLNNKNAATTHASSSSIGGSSMSPTRSGSSPTRDSSARRSSAKGGGGSSAVDASPANLASILQTESRQDAEKRFTDALRREVLILRHDTLEELDDFSVLYDGGAHPIIRAYEEVFERAGQEFVDIVKSAAVNDFSNSGATTTTEDGHSRSLASTTPTAKPPLPSSLKANPKGDLGTNVVDDGGLTAEMISAVEATANALAATGLFKGNNTITASVGNMGALTNNDTFRHQPRHCHSNSTSAPPTPAKAMAAAAHAATSRPPKTPSGGVFSSTLAPGNASSSAAAMLLRRKDSGGGAKAAAPLHEDCFDATMTTAATVGGSSSIGDEDALLGGTYGGDSESGIAPFNRRFKQSQGRIEFVRAIARAVWDILILPFIRDYSRPLTASPPTHAIFEMFMMLFPIHAASFFATSVSADQRKVLAKRLLDSRALVHAFNFPCFSRAVIEELGVSSAVSLVAKRGSGGGAGNSASTASDPSSLSAAVFMGAKSDFRSAAEEEGSSYRVLQDAFPFCPVSLLVASPCTRLGQIYRRHYVGAKGTHSTGTRSIGVASSGRKNGLSVMSVSNGGAMSGGGSRGAPSFTVRSNVSGGAASDRSRNTNYGDTSGLGGPNLFQMLPAGHGMLDLNGTARQPSPSSLVALRNPSPRAGGGGATSRLAPTSRHKGAASGHSNPPSSVASAASSRASSPSDGTTVVSSVGGGGVSPAARPPVEGKQRPPSPVPLPSALRKASPHALQQAVPNATGNAAHAQIAPNRSDSPHAASRSRRGSHTQHQQPAPMPTAAKATKVKSASGGRVVLVRRSTVERVADPSGGVGYKYK